MKPIPLSLLNMSATLYPYAGVDGYGKPTFGAAVSLSQVYIENTKSVSLGSLGEVQSGSITLFFDAVNSLPVGTSFTTLDKIVYDGSTLFVREATKYNDPKTGTLHHWEVTLRGN